MRGGGGRPAEPRNHNSTTGGFPMSVLSVTRGGQEVVVNQWAFEVWMYYLLQEIDGLNAPPPWMAGTREDWEARAFLGLGYDLALDPWADDPDRRAVVLGLCDRALGRLAAQDVLKREALNEAGIGGPGATLLKDMPADLVENVGRRFAALIRGAD